MNKIIRNNPRSFRAANSPGPPPPEGPRAGVQPAVGFGGNGSGVAANGGSELNVWVAIKPDDTCVIRIARSEMGQGTITGSSSSSPPRCDWQKVTTEQITPGTTLRASAPGAT